MTCVVRHAILFASLVTMGACIHRPPDPVPVDPAPRAEPAAPPPIDIPRRDGAPVVMTPVRPVAVALLSPELARLQRWVARHLATQGQVALDVVPFDEVQRVADAASQRQVRPAGPTCAATPPVALALELAFPEAARAAAWADCSKSPCRLIVEVVRSRNGARERIAAWSAEVAAPDTFAAWEAAAQALQPDASAPALVAPELNPVAPVEGPFVRLTRVTPFGAWSYTPAAEEWKEVPFDQCRQKARPVRGAEYLVLEYGADGEATRCEPHTFRDPADSEVLGCYCERASGITLGSGAAGRRVALELRELRDLRIATPDPAVFSAQLSNFKSSDRAYSEDLFAPTLPWLALCYATTRLDSPIQFPVHLEVDATGTIVNAQLGGAARHHVLGGCIEGYVRYQPLPCTASGTPATVDFEIAVGREGPPGGVDQNRPTSDAPPTPGTSRSSALAATSPSGP